MISSSEEFHQKRVDALNESYWKIVAQEYSWQRPFEKVLSGDFRSLPIRWFEDGTLNITENCLDRHLSTRGEKTALVWVPNNSSLPTRYWTYQELYDDVCKMSNLLKACSVKKGDRVCFYMSMVPELLIGVLACARIGAIHSVVFAGLSAKALSLRIQDCNPSLIITNAMGERGPKTLPLKSIVDEALEASPVNKVLVFGDNKSPRPYDINANSLLKDLSNECPPAPMGAEDPLFILYTSGSTGKPKGVYHTTAGYMVWAGETFKQVFQVKENDVFWCTADIGWITGHSYTTYGPLLNGSATLMFEGIPTHPNPGRFWEIIQNHKVTHFYTAPTAIRAFQALGEKFVKPYDLSSLKVLGSVGEPINEEAWEWYHEYIGKKHCPIVDTWWQTETGGIMISSLAGVTESIPAYATYPLPGVDAVLVNERGEEIQGPSEHGSLCIKRPWPGIARGIWGDFDRYQETYFSANPGMYTTGDGAKRDEKNRLRITGRIDDVINVSGHRIGSAEVEEALNEHPSIVESAVIGLPHPIKGESLEAFLILSSPPGKNLKKEIDQLITKLIGPIAKPENIQIVNELPKTRSGKIMRRILKAICTGKHDQLGDTSTLLNPEIIPNLIKEHQASSNSASTPL